MVVLGSLARLLSTTNAIAHLIGPVRDLLRRVKRWRDERMSVRWTVTAVANTSKRFRASPAHEPHIEAGDRGARSPPATNGALESRATVA